MCAPDRQAYCAAKACRLDRPDYVRTVIETATPRFRTSGAHRGRSREAGDMAYVEMNPLAAPERLRPAGAVEPISHRGFWMAPEEENTEGAFRRALEAGFGIETDVRDRDGQAVIAHEPDEPQAMLLSEFLQLYGEYASRPVLALNIKADGLQRLVKEQLERHDIEHYFVFDMSVPDLLGYRAQGVHYYTRVSEYEYAPAAIDEADGVWLDQFETDWVDQAAVRRFADLGKAVCIVSPELHRRDPRLAWASYRNLSVRPGQGPIYLCTDFPSRAREFFA